MEDGSWYIHINYLFDNESTFYISYCANFKVFFPYLFHLVFCYFYVFYLTLLLNFLTSLSSICCGFSCLFLWFIAFSVRFIVLFPFSRVLILYLLALLHFCFFALYLIFQSVLSCCFHCLVSILCTLLHSFISVFCNLSHYFISYFITSTNEDVKGRRNCYSFNTRTSRFTLTLHKSRFLPSFPFYHSLCRKPRQ